jgi:hypothetical protein
MNRYKHTQVGTAILWSMGLAILGTGAITIGLVGSGEPVPPVVGVCVVVLLLSMAIFGSLTVAVSEEQVRLWFGPGLIRKSFGVRDIRDAAIVRNRWYYGWGIRLTPHGWLFNVSGLDAVELRLGSGRTFRIGTDEPAELLRAIQSVLAAR